MADSEEAQNSEDKLRDLDLDAAIVRDERERNADDIDQRMSGAVMAEVCVTIPRIRRVQSERILRRFRFVSTF